MIHSGRSGWGDWGAVSLVPLTAACIRYSAWVRIETGVPMPSILHFDPAELELESDS